MENTLRESYSRGSKSSGGTKELEDVTIREADNGGFIVRCSYKVHKKGEDFPGYESTEKVFESLDGVTDLLSDLF